MPSYGMLCKPPEGTTYYWGSGNPELIGGWHWWGYGNGNYRDFSLSFLRGEIARYRRSSPGWRYQIVRTG